MTLFIVVCAFAMFAAVWVWLLIIHKPKRYTTHYDVPPPRRKRPKG